MNAPATPSDGFLNFCAEVKHWEDTSETLDERAQARLLVKLAEYRTAYENFDQWFPVCDAARRLCALSAQRLSQLLVINSPREMRMALRSTGEVPEPRPREPDEAVYPTSGWISDYMDLHSHVEAPYAFHFWCAVAVVAACARRNYFVEWNMYPVYANHYIMLVQPSGGGKSVATIGQAEKMVRLVNEDLRGAHGDDVEFPGVTLHAGAGTPEGFCDRVAIQPGRTESTGMIINDELITLFGDKQGASDRWVSALTNFYTKEEFEDSYRTQKTRTYRNVAITTLFGTTQDWLRKEFTAASLANGWMARLLYVDRGETDLVYPFPPPVDPVVRRRLAREVAALCLASDQEVLLTDDAHSWYDNWYRGDYKPRGRTLEPIMKSWHNRLRTHVVKLALVLALCERPRAKELTVAHLEQAAAILAVEESRLPKAFAGLTAPEQVDQLERLLTIMRAHGRTQWRKLMKNGHRIGSTREIRELVEAGIETGQLHLERDTEDCRAVVVCLGPRPSALPSVDPPQLPASRRRGGD